MLPQKLQDAAVIPQSQLEDFRRKLLADRSRRLTTSGIIAGVCAAILITTIITQVTVVAVIAGIATFIALICMIFFASKASSEYATAYKREICGLMARHFSPDMTYDEDDGISSATFVSSGLFAHPDRYNTHDLVAGTYGKTKLRFARVHAEQRHTERTKKGTRTHYTTIFKGVFFMADFNKNFRGRTYVRTDFAEKLLGKFGRMFQEGSAIFSSAKLVQLESPGFEKAFSIYADDQVEARYILSPALMERMLALKKRCMADVQFSFHDSSIVIAIPNSADLFSASISVPATDVGQLETVYRRFVFFFSIIDDLDLNTRIWSKE